LVRAGEERAAGAEAAAVPGACEEGEPVRAPHTLVLAIALAAAQAAPTQAREPSLIAPKDAL